MNKRILKLFNEAGFNQLEMERLGIEGKFEKFTELIVQECIDKIETNRIPVGNSAAGEMACEWTYDALVTIRDDIKDHFGVDKSAVDSENLREE